MKTRNAFALAGAAFLGGVLLGADTPAIGTVMSVASAPVRVAPSGKARVWPLSPAGAAAFVGVLELDAGARVPPHRDPTDEFVYVLSGGGVITMGGKPTTVKPGDLITMPAGLEVQFESVTGETTRVLQVFAPGDPASKYDGWAVAP